MLSIRRWRLPSLALALALAGCGQREAPSTPAATDPPPTAPALAVAPADEPKLLDPGMRTALTIQTGLVEEAAAFTVSERLPNPPSPAAEGEQAPTVAEPNAAATVPDHQKIALMFTGHDVGELDPCG